MLRVQHFRLLGKARQIPKKLRGADTMNRGAVEKVCDSAVVSASQIVAANTHNDYDNYHRRRIKAIGILQMNLLVALGAEQRVDPEQPAAPVKEPKYKRGRHPVSAIA